jgi:hypothetical protein
MIHCNCASVQHERPVPAVDVIGNVAYCQWHADGVRARIARDARKALLADPPREGAMPRAPRGVQLGQ